MLRVGGVEVERSGEVLNEEGGETLELCGRGGGNNANAFENLNEGGDELGKKRSASTPRPGSLGTYKCIRKGDEKMSDDLEWRPGGIVEGGESVVQTR